MTLSISTKDAKVLIVETRVDVKGVIRESLKDTGFGKTMIASSVQEALEVIADPEQTPDWVVCGLLREDKLNAFSLLSLFLKESKLHHCRLSLLLQDEERFALPAAFELGLLSWHKKPFTQSSLAAEFGNLVTRLRNDPTNGCLTASEYLRAHLCNLEQYELLIKMETDMAKFFPHMGELHLKVAEAYQMAGRLDEARKKIHQAKYLGESVMKGAKQLLDMLDAEESKEPGDFDISFSEAFGVEQCVIIDSDSTNVNMIKETMASIGFKEIVVFSDGVSAWDWISQREKVDLIIQEWRLMKLTGPALLQRLRAKGLLDVPVIVVSSLVKEKDHYLLKELGVTQVVEKPIDLESFIATVTTVVRESKFPASIKEIEWKVHCALTAKNIDEAKRLRDALVARPDAQEAVKDHVEAEIAFFEGDLPRAKGLAMGVLKKKGDSLLILNLLGKIFLKMREFEDATKCFNKVKEFSAQNLERLCMLAEAQAEMGNFKEAQLAIDDAKRVDAGSRQVAVAETKIALTSGDTAKAKDLMATIESVNDVVAYTNNRAVALAKSGNVAESYELYERVLATLPIGERKVRPIILYNLGLGHLRAGDMAGAQKHLEAGLRLADKGLREQLQKLTDRVAKAVATGTKVQFAQPANTPLPPKEGRPNEAFDRTFALDIKPGDMCLHQIFRGTTTMEQNIADLLKPQANFKFRAPA